METTELIEKLKEERYFDIKIINGKVCGLYRFIFTVGLVVDMTIINYSHRYCYSNLSDARSALKEYEDLSQHPTGPWIVKKGLGGDLPNPELYDTENQQKGS